MHDCLSAVVLIDRQETDEIDGIVEEEYDDGDDSAEEDDTDVSEASTVSLSKSKGAIFQIREKAVWCVELRYLLVKQSVGQV